MTRDNQTHRFPAAAAVALIALLTASTALAESPDAAPEGPKWTLQVDPLTTALGLVHLQVERALGERFSLYAGPNLKLFDGIIADPDEPSITGVGLEMGLRWFFSPGAPEGGWVLVRGVGALLQTRDDSQPGGYISALAGYTWIFDGWLVLSGGGGVQFIHLKVKDAGTGGV